MIPEPLSWSRETGKGKRRVRTHEPLAISTARGLFMSEKVLMTEEDIRRTLARIAHEIIERSKSLDNVVLIGMYTRGVPLAQRLAQKILKFSESTVPVGALD